MFKNRTGHQGAKCVEGKKEWGGGISIFSLPVQDKHRSCSRGVHGGAPAENDLGAFFLPEKSPLVNEILLNVVKCCVIKLLK